MGAASMGQPRLRPTDGRELGHQPFWKIAGSKENVILFR